MSEGPFTAHTCAESSHHREEANRLRELLCRLDASNEQLATDLAAAREQLAAERADCVREIDRADKAEAELGDARGELAYIKKTAEEEAAQLATERDAAIAAWLEEWDPTVAEAVALYPDLGFLLHANDGATQLSAATGLYFDNSCLAVIAAIRAGAHRKEVARGE